MQQRANIFEKEREERDRGGKVKERERWLGEGETEK
jgi:hypothetical protein